MAITIDATVGGAGANSYITLAEAETYFEGRTNIAVWTAASDALKDVAMAHATRMLEDVVSWVGRRHTEAQALSWPRDGVTDKDGWWIEIDEIPPRVKNACAELAFKLIESDRTAEAGTEGFSEIKVGSITLKVDKRDRVALIPPTVTAMISGYVLSYSDAASGNVKLLRA